MTYTDERNLPIFIHSELDDAGLSVYAFRIYCRIARRAGQNGTCFESTPHMADGCGMSRKRASKAIKELKQRGMVRVNRRPGKTSEIVLTQRSEWTTPVESTQGENDRAPRSKTPDPPRSKTPDKGTPSEGTAPKKNAAPAARAREDLGFLPEKHAYLKPEIRSNLNAYRDNQVDLSHLAKRLLARGNTGYPKTVVAAHIRDYPTEHVIAAWTIASSSATSNWTKYADTILREGFREQPTARRSNSKRGDAGSSDVASGPNGRMGQWGEYA